MTIIGLTGGIGSGKSAASRFFAANGFDIIDADQMTRRLHHDPGVCAKLAQLFGSQVLDHSSDHVCVNRHQLAAIVFASKDALDALNQVMQPALYQALMHAIESSINDIVLDAALLFEAGWNKLADRTIVVLSSVQNRIQRVTMRDNLNESQIRARMNAQISDAQRILLADYILYNTADLLSLKQQVAAVCANLQSLT